MINEHNENTKDNQLLFYKSSYCGSGACVEVALLTNGGVALRDGKNVPRDPLVFTTDEWYAFVRGVKAGEFDLSQKS